LEEAFQFSGSGLALGLGPERGLWFRPCVLPVWVKPLFPEMQSAASSFGPTGILHDCSPAGNKNLCSTSKRIAQGIHSFSTVRLKEVFRDLLRRIGLPLVLAHVLAAFHTIPGCKR